MQIAKKSAEETEDKREGAVLFMSLSFIEPTRGREVREFAPSIFEQQRSSVPFHSCQ